MRRRFGWRRTEVPAGTGGVARLDVRTKRLAKRVQPGEVAIIDHVDLDKVAADSLVRAQVAAVVNVGPCTSGRYPNLGPSVLVEAGIPVLDAVGPEVFSRVREGDLVRLEGDTLLRGDEAVATGRLLDVETVAADMEAARQGLSSALEAFAVNTLDYVQRERALLLDGVGVPETRTSFEGRHALVVVRGYHYREDLATLRAYIREYKPVLVGVDGGADALLDAGLTPDVIIGDMDSVSDEGLCSGAEIVVHAYPDGRAPGLSRVESLGVQPVVFPAAATSEDCAMLLADEKGATLIVAVGTHATLVEFLDKGRAGMASTFLTRLRVGGKLVDAKGVSRLYRTRISGPSLALLAVAALLVIAVVIGLSTAGQIYLDLFVERVRVLWNTASPLGGAGSLLPLPPGAPAS